MKDTLIIMGSAATTRGLFDFSRDDCDVIVFNEAAKQDWVKRVDYVTQLHDPIIWRNPQNRNDPKHYQWLKETTIPVLMREKYDDVPASVKYPKDEVLSMLPNAKANGKPIREVDCSPSWALAWGIYQGYKKIEVYGVELNSNTEYHYQQGNFKYWVGVAAGKGIEIDIYSSMFGKPLYGYEGEVSIPYETFGERIAEIASQREKLAGESAAHIIAMWSEFDKLESGENPHLLPAVQRAIMASGNLGIVDGVIQENARYKGKADEMRKTSGDFIFSRQEFEQGGGAAGKKIEEATQKANIYQGQLSMVHNSAVKAAKGSPKRAKALSGYKALLQAFLQVNNAIGLWRGVYEENIRYMQRLDAGIKAAGGVKSEEAILKTVGETK